MHRVLCMLSLLRLFRAVLKNCLWQPTFSPCARMCSCNLILKCIPVVFLEYDHLKIYITYFNVDIPMSVGVIDIKTNPSQLNAVEFLWDPTKCTSAFIQV